MTDKTYAHIFKARGGFELYLTGTPSLVGAFRYAVFDSLTAAKAQAAALNAKPWNYKA